MRPEVGRGPDSVDPLIREAHLMARDYIDYVTSGGSEGAAGTAPSACTAALRHAGDQLLTRFPIFFRRWPRVFQDVTEETACPTLLAILDQHFLPPVPGGRRHPRPDLAWSAVLSAYVLAGQMALHCQGRGMKGVLPQLKECVGGYVEKVVCPQIEDKGGWSGFVSRFGEQQDLEVQVKKVCCWTLLLFTLSFLSYCLWKTGRTR